MSTAPEPVAAGHDGLRGKKVLIVDDDLRNVFAITSILELYGLTVVHASDGRTGIEVLRDNPDIDIVLMDVMMPEMDGYATTAAIREMPRPRDLPVIAVTARAMHGDRDKSIAAGATDYVTKPVDTEDLLGVMERWLSRGLNQEASGAAAAAPRGAASQPGCRWNSSTSCLQKAGKSSGLRLVTKTLGPAVHTCTSVSTQAPPALRMSVRRLGQEVSVRPRTRSASTRVHGPWQITAAGLPAWNMARTKSTAVGTVRN